MCGVNSSLRGVQSLSAARERPCEAVVSLGAIIGAWIRVGARLAAPCSGGAGRARIAAAHLVCVEPIPFWASLARDCPQVFRPRGAWLSLALRRAFVCPSMIKEPTLPIVAFQYGATRFMATWKRKAGGATLMSAPRCDFQPLGSRLDATNPRNPRICALQ